MSESVDVRNSEAPITDQGFGAGGVDVPIICIIKLGSAEWEKVVTRRLWLVARVDSI